MILLRYYSHQNYVKLSFSTHLPGSQHFSTRIFVENLKHGTTAYYHPFKMKRFLPFLMLFCLLSSFLLRSQGGMDEAMAAEFYRNGEFDKAAVLYKKLLEKQPAAVFYYDSYLNCILQ